MTAMQPDATASPFLPAGDRGRRGARRMLAALALCAMAQGVHAGVFDDEEARKRIDQTNQRVDKLQRDLETRLNSLEQQGLVDLLNQVEMLKSEVAKLRGQLEVTRNDLEQAQKRQKDLYLDLDARLRKFETAATPAATADAPSTAAPPPPASQVAAGGTPTGAGDPGAGAGLTSTPAEQRAYDGALDQFKRGDYPGAVAGFTAFVKAYPRGALAASAQYWIGNSQFARKDYRAAIAAQRQLLQAYPDSQKVPDAMLNIASAQSELGDSAAARRTLEDLIGKYPQSEAAVKAKQRLGQR
jgi:tol-pal system protein YbgF